MSVELLATYVAMDRRHALARGLPVPDRTDASVLLADISGFTPMTEALVEGLGPRRGAEELTRILNRVYGALVSRVHDRGGSVVCFIGDALVGVFDGDPGAQAVACALEMQETMRAFETVSIPGRSTLPLAMKAAVETGSVRRFLVGDPSAGRIDVLAGSTVERLTDAEHVAERGDVVVSPTVMKRLGSGLELTERRGPFGVVGRLLNPPEPSPWPSLDPDTLDPESLRALVPPQVFARVTGGQGTFLAELRPIAALFLRFEGIDYDAEEDAGEKLDALTSWVQSIVRRLGGHVLLLTTADKGSHLYAAFGALEAHEDDADRAVAAAMALAAVPPELDFVHNVRIGVSQGRVRVGGYGGETRRTYGALGETVNLAARLMSAAPPGEVRCSAGVHAATTSRFAFDVLPEITLKGMRRPQVVYRPMGRRDEPRAVDRVRLVGRTEEVARLRRALEDVAGGARRVLFVEGEAGIGKSCLVGELRRMASQSGAGWLFGAASSIEPSTPYRAWRGVIGSLFGLDSMSDPQARRARVVGSVIALDPAYESRAPLLNDVLGLDLPETEVTRSYDPRLRQEGLASLIGELLRRHAEARPLVLVLDDVHWMDTLSWDLTLSVARSLVDRPALLTLACRPLGEPVPRPFRALSDWEETIHLRLGSLPPEETAAVAAGRLGLPPDGLPQDLADLLVERAEGNPFYALELVGALRDRELIRVEEGRCSIVGDAAALRESLPDTLEGVVLSRIDQLPVGGQLAVKVASVIGRSFLFRTLRDVFPGGIEPASLRAQLDETDRRQLTMLETEDPERVHAFRHAVTQQVAYDTLLFEQRRSLHGEVAEWIEAAYADQLPPHFPLLAFHWHNAEAADKECEYAGLAGRQAAAHFANVEALGYFSRVVDLLGSLEAGPGSARRREALVARAGVLAVLGRVDDERADLEALRAISERPEDAGGADLLWSDFHRRGGRFAEAVEEAERALERLRQTDDPLAEARALTAIGSALEGLGQFADARTRVEEALAIFRERDELLGQATSLKTLGIVSARLGEFPQAMARFGESHELFRRLGNRKGEAEILGNLGAISYYLGEFETTIENTKAAERVFREMGNRAGTAKCLMNVGNAYSDLGAFEQGLEYHERALEIFRQLEDADECAGALFNVGKDQHALGVGGYPNLCLGKHADSPQLLEAIARYEGALEAYTETGSQRGKVLANFKLGTAQLCTGDLETAAGHLNVAHDLSREMQWASMETTSLAALARQKLLAGDLEEALALSQEAIVRLGDSTPPDANEIHFTRFRVLEKAGRLDQARPHLETSYALIVEQAESIRDAALRQGFLAACREIVTARDMHAPST